MIQQEAGETFRYERKFFIPHHEFGEVEGWVRRNPAMFRPLYHPRWINNVYLDTEGLHYYLLNVHGDKRRLKARVRWYGDPFGPVRKPRLEFKIKEGMVGRKEAFPVSPFQFEEGFDAMQWAQWVAAAEWPHWVRTRLSLTSPVLFNRYRRAYYLSADGQYRVTIDSHLQFYHLCRHDNQFLRHRTRCDCCVLELKYGKTQDAGADQVARHFPFRLTRSSKYVMGVNVLLGR